MFCRPELGWHGKGLCKGKNDVHLRGWFHTYIRYSQLCQLKPIDPPAFVRSSYNHKKAALIVFATVAARAAVHFVSGIL
jgi:hypothetical protein